MSLYPYEPEDIFTNYISTSCTTNIYVDTLNFNSKWQDFTRQTKSGNVCFWYQKFLLKSINPV